LRSCDTTLKRPPDWAEAYNLCGLILYDIGHTEEAIAAYAEAVCLDPSFGDARRNLLRAGDSLMVYAFILLIRIPLPIKKDRWSCRECGASW
jgi:tetratricopeptide (TPR) repeat protein